MSPKARETKTKINIKQTGLHQTKKLLHSKENYQQNKKAAYWIGKYICKQYIWQGVNIQTIQRTHATQHQKNK